MAKRKRLTPAQGDYLASPPAPSKGLGPAPIASVAGEAASAAALAEVSSALQAARDEGRLIEALPLDAIAAGHLVRDRIQLDEDEMSALMASLTARGQQTPIEVVRLGEGRYGLISGWRRLTALRRLYEGTGEARFATVKALVSAPESAEAAYVAMVEENEIRANLSHYERARIAHRAVAEGVFETPRAALQGLYGSVTRSKRSKIGSFMGLVEALDDVLRYPWAISEKLGLALVKRLEEGGAEPVRAALAAVDGQGVAEELAALQAVLEPPAAPAREPAVQDKAAKPLPDLTRYDITADLVLRHWPDSRRIEISGGQVDDRLLADLKDWLERR
ncbi:MAG: chromosome partitioning protein ParB [Rhodobacteraceae bacterium]|nr:chromosome partitioning protein ParB [Paracoccaceae bacterium]MBB96963.1 chromosome partitioning protein ParB [Paracoccaceae bacterium]